MNSLHELILRQAPIGYALFAIVRDSYGTPCDCEFLEVNASFERLTGIHQKEIIGRRVTEVIPHDVLEIFHWADIQEKVMMHAKTIEFQQYESTANRHYHITAYPVEKEFLVILLDDISVEIHSGAQENSELEELMQIFNDQESKINCVFESIQDYLFIKDKNFIYVGCNQAFINSIGRKTKKEVIGKTDFDLLSQEEAQKVRAYDEKLLQTGVEKRIEDWFTQPEGSRILANTAISPLRGLSHQIIGIIGTGHDTTSVRKISQQIETERELFNSGPVAVFVWQPEEGWPVEYVSKNIYEILGYASSEFNKEGFNFEQLVHPEDLQRVKDEVRLLFKQGVDHLEQSYRLLHKDGFYQWFYDFTVTERDEKGNVIRLRGYIFNQSRLKKVEMSLAKERVRLKNILEGTNVGTWEWHIQTQELVINERWAEIIGYTLEELGPITIQTWERFTHPEDLKKSYDLISKHMAGEINLYEMECRMLHKNGEWVWIADSGKVVEWDDKHQPLLMSGTHIDITKKRQAEEILRHKEKLSAIGQLAGGIAHDFNNQLMIISSYADLLSQLNLGDIAHGYIERIVSVTNRSSHLIKQLLAFSKKGKYEVRIVNMATLIKDVAVLLRYSFDKSIEIETHIVNIELNCMIDPSLIESALINIFLNAKDAMPKGGKIQITLDKVRIERKKKTAISDLVPGEYLLLKISDTGVGIEEHILPHIFEPFFTTKGAGTGMGLSAVFGTIRRHLGGIDIVSARNVGTTFSIYLPLTQEQPIEVSEIKSVDRGNDYNYTLLVVDDEILISEVLRTYMSEIGYRVVAFNDSREAFNYYVDQHTHINLVILDVLMPYLNGYELFEKMLEVNSEIQVVYLSGYSADFQKIHPLTTNVRAFLEKPVKLKDLEKVIYNILNHC